MTPEIISALPELEKGGSSLVLAGVLIWLLAILIRRMDKQDANHRKEREDQELRHQDNLEALMASHSGERKEWVSKIENATDKFAKATTDQGERIARAMENAIRSARS